MGKRIRLLDSDKPTIKLKTNSIDFFNLKEKATVHISGRGIRQTHPIIAVEKNVIESIIQDYEKLIKQLKKAGIPVERPLHYSQTESFKAEMHKPVSKINVPEFLKKDMPKRGRIKL
jgi:hypothetical protein